MRVLFLAAGLISIVVGAGSVMFCLACFYAASQQPMPEGISFRFLVLLFVLFGILPLTAGIVLCWASFKSLTVKHLSASNRAVPPTESQIAVFARRALWTRVIIFVVGMVATWIGLIVLLGILGLNKDFAPGESACARVIDTLLVGFLPVLWGPALCWYSVKWTGGVARPGVPNWLCLPESGLFRFFYGAVFVYAGPYVTGLILCDANWSISGPLSALPPVITVVFFCIMPFWWGIQDCRRGLKGQASPYQQAYEREVLRTSNARSVWQFVIFFVLSAGLYAVYWFYRNWKELAAFSELKIRPALRTLGLLVPIYNFVVIYRQLAYVRKIADAERVEERYSPFWLTAGAVLTYGGSLYLLFFADRIPGLLKLSMFMVLIVLMSLLIATVQRTLNAFWTKVQPGLPMRSRYSEFEVNLPAIGIWIAIFILYEYWDVLGLPSLSGP